MKKNVKTSIIAVIWVVTALLHQSFSFENMGRFFGSTFAWLYLMVCFYLFYEVLVPYFLEKMQIVTFTLVSVAVLIVMPFFGYTVLFLIKALADGTFVDFYKAYSLEMHFSGLKALAYPALLGSLCKVVFNWFDAMQLQKN